MGGREGSYFLTVFFKNKKGNKVVECSQAYTPAQPSQNAGDQSR